MEMGSYRHASHVLIEPHPSPYFLQLTPLHACLKLGLVESLPEFRYLLHLCPHWTGLLKCPCHVSLTSSLNGEEWGWRDSLVGKVLAAQSIRIWGPYLGVT